MRIVFAGTPDVAIPTLDALFASTRHEIVGVLTRPPAPQGRTKTLTDSAVSAWAQEHGIPVLTSTHPDAHIRAELSALRPVLGVVVAYGAILDSETLTIPVHGWINLHFSDLPHWRGAAPVQHAILNGQATIGTTVFQLVAALDAGDVFDTRIHAISPDATSGTVLSELAQLGAIQVVDVVDAIESGTANTTPQLGDVTIARKLESSDARLDPTQDARASHNRFRAVTPEPGAWLDTEVGRIKILEASFSHPQSGAPEGTIRLDDGRVLCGFRGGSIELVTLVPAGKRAMSAIDWFRGVRATSVSVVTE